MKRIISVLIVSLGFIVTHAQTLKQYISAGDEAFENKNYYFALQSYKTALEIDSTRTNLLLKAAESSRRMLGYTTAAKMYKTYISSFESDTIEDNRAYFWYGLSLMNQGLYDSASHEFTKYLGLIDSNEVYYGQKARISLESCDFAELLIENPANVLIDSSLEKLNTPYSDFAPFVYKDKLYYSSLNYQPKKQDPLVDRNISKILTYEFEDEEIMLLDQNVNHENLLSSNSSLDEETGTMYFTICHYLKGAEIVCNIFSTELDENDKPGTNVKLPANINVPTFTATHPSVMKDPNDGKKYLLFVSDRPDGQGLMDIWKSEILGDNLFGTPRNLETINTFDDDVTPYYNSDNAKLYFASKGRVGMGEFDLYQAQYRNGKWIDISNLGYPINGPTNDLYPFIAGGAREGYFASNRPGSILFYEEEDACCYDLYKFKAKSRSRTIYLSTLMNTPLELNVEPLDMGKDVISVFRDTEFGRSIQNPDSLLQFIFMPNKDYVGNDKFSVGLCSNSSKDFCDTVNFIIEVRPIPEEIHEFTTKEFTKLSDCVPLIGFSSTDSLVITPCDDGLKNGKISYTVLDDKLCFEYLPDYGFLGLDQMCLEICNANPKDKCIRKILKFDVIENNLDAQLPVVLYFDNDMPKMGKTAQTTRSDYNSLHSKYIVQKNNFIREYVTLLDGQEKQVSTQEMNSFFDNVVGDCDDDLDRFLGAVYRLLNEGNKLEVYIKGFTSPRAAEGYNIELSKRRINSVINYFKSYQGGKLNTHIQSGSLMIKETPIGEAQAPDYVSDDLNDPRNSVYSIEASVERRVEIVDVKKIETK